MIRNRIRWIWYASVKSLAQMLFVCFFGVRVFGRRNVPEEGGAILASNHQSYLDPALLVIGLKRHVHFMAREELFEIPVFGGLIRSLNAFCVKRGVGDRAAIRMAVDRIGAGSLVVMFPEGTRVDSGTLGEIMPGAAFVARKANCPVIPAAVYGAHRAWPMRYRIFHFAPIKVMFGPPIRSCGKTTGEVMEEIEEGIKDLLGKMV